MKALILSSGKGTCLPKPALGSGVWGVVKKKNIHTLKGIKPLRSCMEKEKCYWAKGTVDCSTLSPQSFAIYDW